MQTVLQIVTYCCNCQCAAELFIFARTIHIHNIQEKTWLSFEPIRKVKLRSYNLNVMDNIYDDVVPRMEGPDLGQDHEGSLQQPDQPPLVLQ